MRVVLDTDVVLSGYASPGGASRLWLRAVLRRQARMIVSVPLAIEYEAVLTRPENLARAGASQRDALLVLDAMLRQADFVMISYLWRPTLRDPGDEMVLETAMNGQAGWIISFNTADFAGAERFGVRVERPGPAWRYFRERGS